MTPDMTPERFRQIQELYDAAREGSAEERAELLAQADPELRREVESLLVEPTGGEFLDRPAIRNAPHLLEDSIPTGLASGSCLGPYRIESKLGEGGMGEVFRAIDTRLGRAVAIKTTRQQFNDRFEREARTISALNHPHICTLYDVGPNYLVMELVEGETLAARLKRGTLSVEDTLRYSGQIADALAAAHAKGIIHRDLKPGNIMLSKTGVKVLDFGLAKSLQDETLTASRVVMGTPAYMAPEQREGKECDARADNYSLGLVIREMCASVPALLEEVIEKCLATDPADRWESARDVKIALELAGKMRIPAVVHRPRKWLYWTIIALLVVLTGVTWWGPWRRPAPGILRFQIAPNNNLIGFNEALSPDGRRLAYVDIGTDGRNALYVRDMDALQSRMLPGTEGAQSVFWSPDSRRIAFGTGRLLKQVDAVEGSPPQSIAEVSFNVGAGAWNKDGVIIFNAVGTGALRRVSESGGPVSDATVLDSARRDVIHAFPSFLPDGKHFLYYLNSAEPGHQGIYIGSLDLPAEKQSPKLLLAAQFKALYQPSTNAAGGNLLFVRDGTLLAQPFDANRLELEGQPVRIAERLGNNNSNAFFTVSGNGALAYREGSNFADRQLTWLDRQGHPLGTVGEPSAYSRSINPGQGPTLRLSPDGSEVAAVTVPLHIWLMELARGVSSRLTSSPSADTYPVWSPNGDRIVFASDVTGIFDIHQKPSNGSGSEELLVSSKLRKIPTSWSPDGRFLLYQAADPKTGDDVWVLPMDSTHTPTLLLQTPFNEGEAAFSPDSRWIAFSSNETGRSEVYVMPFAPAGRESVSGVRKVRVSKDGGSWPQWRADGKELYFTDPNRVLMCVNVASNSTF